MKEGLYSAPQADIKFVLREVLQVEEALGAVAPEALVDQETLEHIIEGADRFCSGLLAPLNRSGDIEGCRYQEGTVTTPQGFREAYQQYMQGGWSGLCAKEAVGGQELPMITSAIMGEMLGGSNISWALYPRLSEGAYRCLVANASPEIRQRFAPKLASGEWTGTMCLTEAGAGTDLGLLKTRAVPNEDGTYAIEGTKIFISSGDHDFTENIVHLVLARLPDAPAGTRGISLFAVPKKRVDAQGNVGALNHVFCDGIEEKMGLHGIASCVLRFEGAHGHVIGVEAQAKRGGWNRGCCDGIEEKMGLHGNATCVLRFEGAQGHLISEENRGLAGMFVMMNTARVGTGIQALGINEWAYQKAVAYAYERVQSRSPEAILRKQFEPSAIIEQPDVRRMLMKQKVWAESARMFLYWLSLQLDYEQHGQDPEVRARADGFLSLLTPIAKAFVSDNALESVSLSMQVHGGSGYIDETGVEQLLRDVRILPIYEGTNGVQSFDLLVRKVIADEGARLKQFFALIDELVQSRASNAQAQALGQQVSAYEQQLLGLTQRITELLPELIQAYAQDPAQVAFVAADFLRVVGHTVYGYFWLRVLHVVAARDEGDALRQEKTAAAAFYFQYMFVEVEACLQRLSASVSAIEGPHVLPCR